MSRPTRPDDELLLGEWACLGILAAEPSHGFAVSVRLRPDGDIGRVWSLSRALTYRAIDRLRSIGHVAPVGEEPGLAGGNRTILDVTPSGRTVLHGWMTTPVPHLRDLRSELLLKLTLAGTLGIDTSTLVEEQRKLVIDIEHTLRSRLNERNDDLVTMWRLESAEAALRFLNSSTRR